MADKPKYDPLKRLFKVFFELVNTLNARKHVDKEKEAY
jgi:hypothetical protein